MFTKGAYQSSWKFREGANFQDKISSAWEKLIYSCPVRTLRGTMPEILWYSDWYEIRGLEETVTVLPDQEFGIWDEHSIPLKYNF